MLTVGSLFAGIGGFDLGLERAGMRSVWQCEIDPYAQRVLEKHWPDVLRVPDIRDVGAGTVPWVDVICGGFPCQDISYAGLGAGLDGERSGLWSEMLRVIRELRPRWVVVENVAALFDRGLDVVLGGLAASGYDAEWDCLPASAFGAPHQRDRIWLVAYPDGSGRDPRVADVHARQLDAAGRGTHPDADSEGCSVVSEHHCGPVELGRCPSGGHADGLRDEVADADRGGRDGRPGQLRSSGRGEPTDGGGESAGARPANWWAVEPPVGRVVDGFPGRVDRVRALGNALVPQIAEELGRRILEYEGALT